MTQPVLQTVNLGDLRIKYKGRGETFSKASLSAREPFAQFHAWFQEAVECKDILEPNAMCLATATKEGRPSSRFVLLKSYSPEGFKFFTNYNSKKAQDLAENPQAAFTIYWQALRRQVRVEGRVEKLSEGEGVEYFRSRPYDNQVGSAASEQSAVVPSRQALVDRCNDIILHHPQDVPKPPAWGGYVLVPDRVEFWQGQSDRLHDRIVFRRRDEGEGTEVDPSKTLVGDDGWLYERLAP